MADPRPGGIRVQDWLGMVMVVVGGGLLVWFSWPAGPLVKALIVVALAAVVVLWGYYGLRDVGG